MWNMKYNFISWNKITILKFKKNFLNNKNSLKIL